MLRLNNITSDASQKMIVQLSDDTLLNLTFNYRPAIQRWTLDVNHPEISLQGLNLCASPNIMRQWKNIVSFGIAIVSTNGLDPIQVEDFQNDVILFNILTQEEVQQVESEILSPVPLINP